MISEHGWMAELQRRVQASALCVDPASHEDIELRAVGVNIGARWYCRYSTEEVRAKYIDELGTFALKLDMLQDAGTDLQVLDDTELRRNLNILKAVIQKVKLYRF